MKEQSVPWCKMQYLLVPPLLVRLPRPDPSEEEECQPSPPSTPGSSCRGTPKRIITKYLFHYYTRESHKICCERKMEKKKGRKIEIKWKELFVTILITFLC